MKIEVNNATPSQLDFLVLASDCWSTATLFLVTGKKPPAYSTDWAHGGVIIEREGISLYLDTNNLWQANIFDGNPAVFGTGIEGSTPLIAAMRCYVASKLGAEVEIPDELKGESK